MFQGTIPPALQSIVVETVGSWGVSELYVGTSGNFTIERALPPGLTLHGNDVQLYSCAVGWFLTDHDFPISVKPEWEDGWGWLTPFLDGPAGKLATVMLCTRMLDGLHRTNHPYFDRMRAGYRSQWDRLYADTRAKLEKVELRLASFHPGDVVDWLEEIPKKAAFVSFPPFWSGGYESMFKTLHEVFEWEEPEYPVLDEERMELMIERIQSRPHWLYGNNERRPGLEDHLNGFVRASWNSVPIFVYSSTGKTRLGIPARKVADPLLVTHLTAGMELGETLQIKRITGPQFVTLREHYLTQKIHPLTPRACYAVLVDGVIVGAFGFDVPPNMYERTQVGRLPGPYVYLLSDFAVTGTDYPRLAKLVVTAALSDEAKLEAERMTGRRARSLTTSAFTDRPVSMKYRGLLDLLSRKETERPEFKYQLYYGARLGQWSLEEGYAQWRTSHGSVSNRSVSSSTR